MLAIFTAIPTEFFVTMKRNLVPLKLSMTKKRYFFLVLILGFLIALSPFSIDMYLPAFEDIAASLHTTSARVDLSLSSYFIGLAFGQFYMGR